MFYITGDAHGNFKHIDTFCRCNNTSLDDYIIILGDSGINYHLDFNAKGMKKYLSKIPINFIVIHGNHEERASYISTYKRHRVDDKKNGIHGSFLIEDNYPNIMFTETYGYYVLNNNSCYVIGGAYSVDKYFRLEHGYNWYSSEQLSQTERYEVFHELRNHEDNYGTIDYILSHTCPKKYTPTEWFLPNVDQSTVDDSMEEFLDIVDDYIPYKKWYCGHYHGEKDLGNIEFMYKSIKRFG